MTHQLYPKIQKTISDRLEKYQTISLAIHERPEVSNYEFFACQTLSHLLKEEGFTIEEGAAGHRTGFAASYKADKAGPVIVFLAEYDALEGIGHACGHNLFGIYSCLAGVALKAVIDDLGGEVRIYGTPGEEGGEEGSAKASFADKGYFDDVDVALCTHPGEFYGPTTTTSANAPVDIHFYGKASHAAAAPEEGINALEALIQVFNTINSYRLKFPKESNIHGIITKGGDAANIIPDHTSARFYLRAVDKFVLKDVYKTVEQIVQGVAQATGTRATFGLFQNQVDDTIVTPKFDQVFLKHLKDLDIPEKDIQRKVENSLGSSDVGNVSYKVPVIQPRASISDKPIPGHSLAFKEAARSRKGLDSIPIVAELLVRTAIDLIEDPVLLNQIKEEHQKNLQLIQNKYL